MAGPTVAVHCPTCGEDLWVVLAPGPPTQWFPCPKCGTPFPAALPRDPPLLYSWEVMPNLYPALPLPRRPRLDPRRACVVALVVVAVLATGLAGVLGYYGFEAPAAGSFSVVGSVVTSLPGGTSPATGARVVLTTESNQSTTEIVGPSGFFEFSNVPTGGLTVNVTLAGYAPVSVLAFVSTIYSTVGGGIDVTLTAGSAANGTTETLTPFPDLESFVASIGAAVVLLGLSALVAGFAAVVTRRSDRPAVGIVGGGAGLTAPFVLFFLALDGAFPVVLAATAVLAGCGAFVFSVRAVDLARFGAGTPDS